MQQTASPDKTDMSSTSSHTKLLFVIRLKEYQLTTSTAQLAQQTKLSKYLQRLVYVQKPIGIYGQVSLELGAFLINYTEKKFRLAKSTNGHKKMTMKKDLQTLLKKGRHAQLPETLWPQLAKTQMSLDEVICRSLICVPSRSTN